MIITENSLIIPGTENGGGAYTKCVTLNLLQLLGARSRSKLSKQRKRRNDLTTVDANIDKDKEIVVFPKKTKARSIGKRRSINKKRLELQESVS